VRRIGFTGDLNVCPPDQELGVLTKCRLLVSAGFSTHQFTIYIKDQFLADTAGTPGFTDIQDLQAHPKNCKKEFVSYIKSGGANSMLW
jgi:hypothetical protein